MYSVDTGIDHVYERSMYARSTTEVMYEQLVDGNGPDSSWDGVGGGTGKQELNLEWPYFRISLSTAA